MATFIQIMKERNRDMNEDVFLSLQSKQGDKATNTQTFNEREGN